MSQTVYAQLVPLQIPATLSSLDYLHPQKSPLHREPSLPKLLLLLNRHLQSQSEMHRSRGEAPSHPSYPHLPTRAGVHARFEDTPKAPRKWKFHLQCYHQAE
jgi:hypothetical protein